MTSKYHFENSSLYIEGTDIPKNKLGITNSEEIHELERELLSEAYTIFYDELNDDAIFDEHYFKELHRRTFEGLFEWAGEYRTFNMAKGESRFCQGAFVASSSKKIFDELSRENYLRSYETLPKDEFARKLTYYKCELIALHPFFELNGRITRLFFDMISARNGYEFIDYSMFSPDEYITASIECVRFANSARMEKIISAGLKK